MGLSNIDYIMKASRSVEVRMLNEDSLTGIFAVTLMIVTVLMLGYHLAHFISKHEFKSAGSYTVIDRLTETGPEVIVLAPPQE